MVELKLKCDKCDPTSMGQFALDIVSDEWPENPIVVTDEQTRFDNQNSIETVCSGW